MSGLDITNKEKGWQIIEVTTNKGWNARESPGCIQISASEILIMGGFNKTFLKDIFIFRPEENTIKKQETDLIKHDSFHQCKPVINNCNYNEVYIFGARGRDIHIFDNEFNRPGIIRYSEWNM